MSNLSPDQFPENGHVSLNDHRESLGLNENFGSIGMHPAQMKRTGEQVEITPDMPVTPGQSTVYAAAVGKYRQQPHHSPISLYRHEDTDYVLDGHHRLVAARLEGRSVRGEYYDEGTSR